MPIHLRVKHKMPIFSHRDTCTHMQNFNVCMGCSEMHIFGDAYIHLTPEWNSSITFFYGTEQVRIIIMCTHDCQLSHCALKCSGYWL